MFSPEVSEKLKYYVYRLIDPRNGETFYVGKGIGNRIFSHAIEKSDTDDEATAEKLVRIRDIKNSGLEVIHVVHRHGLDEETSFEVESALIDAYPGLTNLVRGHDQNRGLMHVSQIIETYEAKEVEFAHKLMLISINKTASERDLYEAVRYAWKIDPAKAREAEYVLAVRQGLILGAFVAEKWLEVTSENFPCISQSSGRWGFVGKKAPEEISQLYVRRRIPDSMRKKGASNPVRYVM